MTSRREQPDTPADVELRGILGRPGDRAFAMVAGAGSGKTTSLVKALASIRGTHGAQLTRDGARIACITYTEVAAAEIWNDVGNDPLFHISTIHSFLWTIVKPFQNDIRKWVAQRINEKIARAQDRLSNSRTQRATREQLTADVTRYERQGAAIQSVPAFYYGTGSNYAKGMLGHDDILRMGPEFINSRKLFRQLVTRQFPFIMVDESQDTAPEIVFALRQLFAEGTEKFCLGFFGDPMQKIYLTGVGPIELGPHWVQITKPENFRCPQSVLAVVNNIRAENDGLRQIRGRTIKVDGKDIAVEGTAGLYLLKADERRTDRLTKLRAHLAETTGDPGWLPETNAVRLLVLVHRMAAARLGFPNLYAALNDKAPREFKEGLIEGTAWVLRPFLTYLLPLVLAVRAENKFEAMRLLRKFCPLLSGDQLAEADVPALLNQIGTAVNELTRMFENNPVPTIRDVLTLVKDQQLATLDPRFDSYLGEADADDLFDEADEERTSMVAFLGCSPRELLNYRTYLEGASPFATHQGVKGAEFDRVLVVLDDEESAYNLFSYEKYFGISPLSATDQKNVAEGNDSVLSRTSRLFYVCCSRATQHLAVAFFVTDPEGARAKVEDRKIFAPQDIHVMS